ncbi:DUF2232 domain-containing protein [Feifania hominis]|uniref:DUF2232 domain-containing protein n=1 Tax=Feifania hominis TaxID=2763660 RepID=A0A926DGG8_9FIRM|nr:DUF2232 domain-containing protein [Feifania hominis]MBC8536610.1 DUF2232 domain-containing protein [Feifania hominis]
MIKREGTPSNGFLILINILVVVFSMVIHVSPGLSVAAVFAAAGSYGCLVVTAPVYMAVLTPAVAGVCAALLTRDVLAAAVTLALFVPAGLVIGLALRRGLPFKTAALYACSVLAVVFAASLLLNAWFATGTFGVESVITYLDMIFTEFQQAYDELIESARQMLSSEQIAYMRDYVGQMTQMLRNLMAGLLLAAAVGLGGLATLLAQKLSERGLALPKSSVLDSFRVSRVGGVVYLAASLVAMVAPGVPGTVAMNLMMVLLCPFLLEGVGTLRRLGRRIRLSPVKVMLILVLMLFLFSPSGIVMFLSFAGAFDAVTGEKKPPLLR